VTLLPPLKYIRSLRSVKVSELSIPNPTKPEPTPEPVPAVETPASMMEQIGRHLGYWRNQKALSIEDVSILTQIQPRLIQAIEEGHIEMLPESVYVKGMIRRYGDCLGMDGEGLAQYVPTWQREVMTFKQTTSTRSASFSTPVVQPIHWYIIYALTILGGSSLLSHFINEANKPTPVALELTKTPVVPTPAAVVVPPVPTESTDAIKVRISVKNPISAEIVVDGNPKVVGNLKAGEAREWAVIQQMTISTNDGGSLFVSRGSGPFQAMGPSGQKQQLTIKVDKKPVKTSADESNSDKKSGENDASDRQGDKKSRKSSSERKGNKKTSDTSTNERKVESETSDTSTNERKVESEPTETIQNNNQ
jgi:hypothetical protein